MTTTTLFLLLAGLNPRKELKLESRESELLQQSARLYWDAVRWGDAERAGVFIEEAPERVIYRDWLVETHAARRVEEVVILETILGPTAKPDSQGRTRSAEVVVRLEAISLRSQTLETERLRQQWYRTVDGWYLDWEAPTGP